MIVTGLTPSLGGAPQSRGLTIILYTTRNHPNTTFLIGVTPRDSVMG